MANRQASNKAWIALRHWGKRQATWHLRHTPHRLTDVLAPCEYARRNSYIPSHNGVTSRLDTSGYICNWQKAWPWTTSWSWWTILRKWKSSTRAINWSWNRLFAAFPSIALAAEHLAIVDGGSASVTPRRDMVTLHFFKFKIFTTMRSNVACDNFSHVYFVATRNFLNFDYWRAFLFFFWLVEYPAKWKGVKCLAREINYT